jgi:hypothetical protein
MEGGAKCLSLKMSLSLSLLEILADSLINTHMHTRARTRTHTHTHTHNADALVVRSMNPGGSAARSGKLQVGDAIYRCKYVHVVCKYAVCNVIRNM